MKNKVKSFFKGIIPNKYHEICMYYFKYIYYYGSEFMCPFCGRYFRRFIPFGHEVPKEKNIVGGGCRLNSLCPNCKSSDRERHIYLYLKHETNLFSNNFKLLHVAPEKNIKKIVSANPNIDYISIDLLSPSVMAKMDISNIGIKEGLFDGIICNHVLEHIPDDRKAMLELFRVLKPGGWAILQVPISLTLTETYEDPSVTRPEEREKIFGQRDHVRIYAKDYKNRLEEIGFSVTMYNFSEKYGKSISHPYGLIEEENIYICSKSI